MIGVLTASRQRAASVVIGFLGDYGQKQPTVDKFALL